MNNSRFREVASGALLATFGVFVALYSLIHYRLGEAAAMGPGYFPLLLGAVLGVIGIIIVAVALLKSAALDETCNIPLRSFFLVIVSIVAFALLVDSFGFIPAALVTTMVSSRADRTMGFRRTITLAIILSTLTWIIFVVGLKMPFDLIKL